MNYKETMDYIRNTAKFGSNLGLERTEKILEFLGNPHKKLKCIHIAGTNGKGSTTAMLTEILKEAGYKTGMYISPYLEEFEERIQINGTNIPKEDLCNVVSETAEAVEKVIALGYEHPTEFEIITCAMFQYFYKKAVDYAVIEVGLGGRLDSTNVITPILSIITSISYDHMKILGNTLGEIAFEKAGIIKENIPVILYPQEEESYEVIKEVCRKAGSTLIEVPRECVQFNSASQKNSDIQNITVACRDNIYSIELSLLGRHQLLNCASVIFAAETLREQGVKIEKTHILRALKKVRWPGRLEILKRNPLVVIDGAHNIDGMRNLTESIDNYFSYNKLILILGILSDKQVEDMLKLIVPKAFKILAVTPHSERAELACDLAKDIAKINPQVEFFEEYETAYKTGLSYCSENNLLLISGSLYMIGDMRKIINNN